MCVGTGEGSFKQSKHTLCEVPGARETDIHCRNWKEVQRILNVELEAKGSQKEASESVWGAEEFFWGGGIQKAFLRARVWSRGITLSY